jgi:hypothetical protein
MNFINKSKAALAAASVFGLMAVSGPSTAGLASSVTTLGTFTSNANETHTLATSAGFTVNGGDAILVAFSAECAVIGGAGDASSWSDIDIQLVNSAGQVVNQGNGLGATSGTSDAFCVANGTSGTDGWAMHSVIVTHQFSSQGTFTIRVIAKGASTRWGERTLVVWR